MLAVAPSNVLITKAANRNVPIIKMRNPAREKKNRT